MQLLRLPETVPDGMAVFQLSFALTAAPPSDDWRLLSADEQARAQRFHQWADRVRFVCTRAALRRLLGLCLQTRPERLTFEAGRHGKPQLAGSRAATQGINFNVSHAGGHALIAVSRQWPVGVDIEWRDSRIDVAELGARVLSAIERQEAPANQVAFFERWTAKEAALKALGLGVGEHLQQLSVLTPLAGAEKCDRYGLQCGGIGWPALEAYRLPAPDGYAAALAWTPASLEVLSSLGAWSWLEALS